MGVAGAAIATVASQAVSAVLVIHALMKSKDMYCLRPKAIRFHKFLLLSIITIGLPAGIQSVMYNLSNMIIQTSLNDLGTSTMAAYTAFGKIDAIYWMISGAFSVAITTFIGQNYGAGKYDRMKKSVTICLFMDFLASVLVSALLLFFGEYLLRLFTADPEVLKIGMKIIHIIAPSYVLFIFIEILSSTLRGMGNVLVPMLMTCGGVCILRIVWIFFVVPHKPDVSLKKEQHFYWRNMLICQKILNPFRFLSQQTLPLKNCLFPGQGSVPKSPVRNQHTIFAG